MTGRLHCAAAKQSKRTACVRVCKWKGRGSVRGHEWGQREEAAVATETAVRQDEVDVL